MAGVPVLVPALFAANGTSPASGAKLYSYIKGTNTPQTFYTDEATTTPAANPTIANSLGATVRYLDPSKNYDLVAKTSDEATTLFSVTYNVDANNISLGTGWEAAIEAIAPWRTPIGLVLDTNTTAARATNTSALQTCIDIGPGRIVLPVGTIYYNDDLDFTNSEKIIFEGAGHGTILTSVTTGGIGFTIGNGYAVASGATNPRQLVFRDFNVGFSTLQTTNAFFVLKNTNTVMFQRVGLLDNAKTWFEIHGGSQQYWTKLESCTVYGGENFAYLIRYPQETIFEDIIGGAPMSGDGIVAINASGVYMTRVSFAGVGGNGFATFPGVPEEIFAGTGSQTAFVLEYEKYGLEVYVNSVLKTGGVDYTYSGKTVTFAVAPAAAAVISVRNVEQVKAVFASMCFQDTSTTEYGWALLSNGGTVLDINLDSVWGASNAEDGIVMDAGSVVNGYQGVINGVQLLGFKAVGNQKRGINVVKASNVVIDSPSCTSNSQAGSAIYDGIAIGAGAVDVSVTGGISGTGGSFPTTNLQRYGISIASGATRTRVDFDTIDLSGNVTGTFLDSSTDARYPGAGVKLAWWEPAADGTTNDRAKIEAAAAQLGVKGGIVWLDASKTYLVDDNLNIPEGVTLKGYLLNPGIAGDSNSEASQIWNLGSRLYVNSSATITLQGAASIENCFIVRKGMTAPENDASAYAGTAITVSGEDTAVRACLILGFNRAVDCNSFQRQTVEDVRGDCVNGLRSTNALDVPRWRNVHFWPFGTIDAASPVLTFGTGHYLFRNGTAFEWSGINDWFSAIDLFCYGYMTGYKIDGAPSVFLHMCGADNISQATTPWVVASTQGFNVTNAIDKVEFVQCHTAAQEYGLTMQGSVSGGNLDLVGFSCWGIKTAGIRITTDSIVQVSGGYIQGLNTLYGTGGSGIILSNSAAKLLIGKTTIIRDFTNAVDGGTYAGAVLGMPYIYNGTIVNTANYSIASASSMAPSRNHDVQLITGTTANGTLSNTYAGHVVTFVFAASCTIYSTITGSTTTYLAGGADFAGTANDTLTLVNDGSKWLEVARSVNP